MKTSVTQLFARKALVTALASATLCGSVGFISSAYAQETTAVIRGIVTDMSGDPVQVPRSRLPVRARESRERLLPMKTDRTTSETFQRGSLTRLLLMRPDCKKRSPRSSL